MMDSYGMRSQALDAIEEALTYSTLGISPDDGENDVGSCVALSYEGKKFIVTARHVVEGKDHHDFRFYFRDDEPQRRITIKELTSIQTMSGRQWIRIPVATIILSDEIDDLALLLIDQDYNLKNLRFYNLHSESIIYEEGRDLVLFGFAQELIRTAENIYTGERGYALISCFEWRSIISATKPLNNYDPSKHFLMEFYHDDQGIASPKAMSGCGVWIPKKLSKPGIWVPEDNITLCGIQSSWYEDSRILKATKIERLLALLNTSQ